MKHFCFSGDKVTKKVVTLQRHYRKKMKKFNSKVYLYVAIVGLVLIAGLVAYHLMSPVAKGDST